MVTMKRAYSENNKVEGGSKVIPCNGSDLIFTSPLCGVSNMYLVC